MESLTNFNIGTKCSVIICLNNNFIRRNGIVRNRIANLAGAWCIEILNPYNGLPFYVKAYEKYSEILKPMDEYETLINSLNELVLN